MGDAAYESQVNELMERILAELSANAQRRLEGKQLATELSRYVDYRYYLEYDIECHNQITRAGPSASPPSARTAAAAKTRPLSISPSAPLCADLRQVRKQHPPGAAGRGFQPHDQ